MSYMDWLERIRPFEISSPVRLDMIVTEYPLRTSPIPNWRPAWPAPTIVMLRTIEFSESECLSKSLAAGNVNFGQAQHVGYASSANRVQ
ncbi:hypothetical protein [Thauera butanivorans]|uniref:hypothetical protein n=1 Tax=Thauera butanivorans TaxID=86174 RepID=UPI001FE0D80F|nr:hypothetical protein [Thauera butanivorans]